MKYFGACIFCIGVTLAYSPPADSQERIFESTWALSNSITISDYFQSLYLQHAEVLLSAADRLKNGNSLMEIKAELGRLPGQNGVLIVDGIRRERQLTQQVAAPIDELSGALLSDEGLFKHYLSPMTHRLLGGRCQYRQLNVGGKMYDLIIMPIENDPKKTEQRSIIALLLDRSWLLRQVPEIMDSLSRESTQLLFWTTSPKNDQWEQSIGILSGKDTLWWSGPIVEIKDWHSLYPLQDVKILSSIRKPK